MELNRRVNKINDLEIHKVARQRMLETDNIGTEGVRHLEWAP